MRKKTRKVHLVADALPAQRKKVLQLRAKGLAFAAISREMGWRGDANGSRAYQIVWRAIKDAKDPAALGERLHVRAATVKARTR